VAVLVVQRLAVDLQCPLVPAALAVVAQPVEAGGAALGVEGDHRQQPAGGVDALGRVLRHADPDRLHAQPFSVW
jgi:hypothetical protein